MMRDHRSGGPLLFRDTMPQASERHKRQGGTACRGGDGVPGEQDQPGGEGLRLYGACLLAPAGCTHAAGRDHGPGRPRTGKDYGHAMPSGHRPPGPTDDNTAGAGGGRVVQGVERGELGFFWRWTPGETAGRGRVRRRSSPPAGDGMQESRRVSLLGVKVWTRYTAPSPSPYPTTHPEKEAAKFFPP